MARSRPTHCRIGTLTKRYPYPLSLSSVNAPDRRGRCAYAAIDYTFTRACRTSRSVLATGSDNSSKSRPLGTLIIFGTIFMLTA